MDSANGSDIEPVQDVPGLRDDFYDFGDFGAEEGDVSRVTHGGGTERECSSDFVTDHFPNPPLAHQGGYTFLGLFDSDENSIYRKTNLYYPFSSRRDWQLAAWLLHSGLSMGKIDSFLSLEMIKDLPLSFRSAKELRGRAEILPSVLYWPDPIECIAAIFNHPLFHNCIDLTPRRVYTSTEKKYCVFTEWMTGDDAWDMQSAIPSGATLLSTILSSDKTNITLLTGDCVAHPLLISLTNIHMKIRLKSSSNAFALTALLPVPKFIHRKKRMKGVLEDRLMHQCLNIVLEPLKQAARLGIMLSDPIGRSHYCFTPLASYIADTPEAMMLASVGGKTLPVTMVMYKQFGDPFQHEPQTKSTTLAQLAVKFRLNGVEKPFWSDWVLAEPSHFFTSESLHHLHKQFYDHDAKWLICTVGESEMDFHFSVLQPMTGYRHFQGGISKLKQVTGRCQWDIEQYIIAISADAVPTGILTAVRTLMQFRYLVQLLRIDEEDIKCISDALAEFHANKDMIIAAGVRRGRAIDIHNSGVIGQWSANVTEHAHITEVKDPTRSSNNNNYDPQICRHLDRAEKCRRFELATGLLDFKESTGKCEDSNPDDEDPDVNDDDEHIPIGATRSFVVKHTALHFAYDPSIRKMTEETYGHGHVHAIGGPRRAGPTAILPFDKIQIRVQEKDLYDAHIVRPAQTLNCAPPNDLWTLGRYDTVIVETDAKHTWPSSGLSEPESTADEADSDSVLRDDPMLTVTGSGDSGDWGTSSDSDAHEEASESETGEIGPLTTKVNFGSFFNTISSALLLKEPNLAHKHNLSHKWSAANSSHPVHGEEIVQKTNLTLLDDLEARWDTIKVVCELTASPYLPSQTIAKTLNSKAYLLLKHQPWRCFALFISLCNGYRDLCVHLYDHSGGVVSLCTNIDKEPDKYLHIFSCIVFGNLECIGFDSTINMVKHTLHHTLKLSSSRPTKNLPSKKQAPIESAPMEVIETGDPPIFPPVLQVPEDPLNPEPVLELIGKIRVNKNTVCYLAKKDDKEYIIKDHWVLRGKKEVLNKINMMKKMEGVRGVPRLIEYWLVEVAPGEVDFQRQAAESHKVLHRDSSLNNVMIEDDGDGSHGMLIDWEFAVDIVEGEQYVVGGTGTLPFMSWSLLFSLYLHTPDTSDERSGKHALGSRPYPVALIKHDYKDDLESMFYVFVWTCIEYRGPLGMKCVLPKRTLDDKLN
ncbi:hypothetical protein EV702DRAFT_1204407 [Suillus placidus]|uniref:Uncharacterized protein n=1 Tax=Suillus placidus TaxID=48579 RepID=A0A9P6ZH31_9AGAM|nr:hypothetical protein EV702DRAFT_1204407 [Suillus placidus]